jgi:hypothetical protein
VEAARVAFMLAAEVSTREAVTAWDGATLRINDAEDRAALAKREPLEPVSRAEAENSTALTSAHDYGEGLA